MDSIVVEVVEITGGSVKRRRSFDCLCPAARVLYGTLGTLLARSGEEEVGVTRLRKSAIAYVHLFCLISSSVIFDVL